LPRFDAWDLTGLEREKVVHVGLDEGCDWWRGETGSAEEDRRHKLMPKYGKLSIKKSP